MRTGTISAGVRAARKRERVSARCGLFVHQRGGTIRLLGAAGVGGYGDAVLGRLQLYAALA